MLRVRLAILPLVVGFCSVVLSWRSLPELDLGWHLATGLWMLDNHSVTTLDPFGAQGNHWIAYSWAFDVLLAVVFRAFGFLGLQLFQGLLVFAILASAVQIYRSISRSGSAFELAAIFGLLLLSSPFLYLRPHLFSLLFLLIFILLLESDRLKLKYLLPLSLLWVNIHVYWVLVPALLCLHALGKKDVQLGLSAFLCLLCGLFSPYGFDNVTLLFNYMFSHQQANLTVTEFQSLGLEHGMYLALGVVAVLVIGWMLYYQRARVSLTLLIFALLSCFAAVYQIKYFMFLGLAVFWITASRERTIEGEERLIKGFSWSILGGLIAAIALFLIEPLPAALSIRQQQLASLVAEIPKKTSGVILNHFDDGGALSLYLYQNNIPLKTSIDGRTLVMQAERLSQWRDLSSGGEKFCDTLMSWEPKVAIFEHSSKVAQKLKEGHCGHSWRQLKENEGWQILSSSHSW